MTRSETDICNIAYEALKEPETPDIDNGSLPLHKSARRHFERARSYVLEQRNWQQALTPVSLPALSDPKHNGQPLTEFTRYFQLPNDFVKLVSPPAGVRWGLRAGSSGQLLGANAGAPMTILYVRRLEPSEMNEALATAIGLRMAWQIAPKKSRDRISKNDVWGDYLSAYQAAKLADNGHRSAVIAYGSPWLDAMRGN